MQKKFPKQGRRISARFREPCLPDKVYILEDENGNKSSKVLKDLRKGNYGKPLFPYQIERVNLFPIFDLSNFIMNFGTGNGKTEMANSHFRNICTAYEKDNPAMFFFASHSGVVHHFYKMTMPGDLPYETLTKKDLSKNGSIKFRMSKTEHPCAVTTHIMLSMLFKDIDSHETDSSKMEYFSSLILDNLSISLSPVTKIVLLMIDEVHMLYSTRNPHKKKIFVQFHLLVEAFKSRGIRVQVIGITATLHINKTEEMTKRQATEVEERRKVLCLLMDCPDADLKNHIFEDEKMTEEKNVYHSASERTPTFLKELNFNDKVYPKDVPDQFPLEELSDIILLKSLKALMQQKELKEKCVVLPNHKRVEAALKELVANVLIRLSVGKDGKRGSCIFNHIKGGVSKGVEKVAENVTEEGEDDENAEGDACKIHIWKEVSFHPSAVINFNTDVERDVFYENCCEEHGDKTFFLANVDDLSYNVKNFGEQRIVQSAQDAMKKKTIMGGGVLFNDTVLQHHLNANVRDAVLEGEVDLAEGDVLSEGGDLTADLVADEDGLQVVQRRSEVRGNSSR